MAADTQKYRIGNIRNHKLRKRVWGLIVLLIVALLLASGYGAMRVVQATETEISLPEPIFHEYAPEKESDKAFDEDTFQISLPEDWVLKEHLTTTAYDRYIYHATKKNHDNRSLEIYLDGQPPEPAFNRLLPVITEENRVVVASSVSENCTAFTGTQGANKPTTGPSVQTAKWQGISFSCDMANYSRNVVGAGVLETGTDITLTGPATGKSTFVFRYIDHNINPDYQIFERALESFVVK